MREPSTLRGLVLAGGKSSRMGRDKAAIQLAGTTLLDRAVQLLAAHVTAVYVSVREGQIADDIRRRHALIVDRAADIGPAAGILAAHAAHPDSAWLVLACDMPYLDDEQISALVAGRDASRSATAWLRADQTAAEPLCAIYEPGNLASFAAHIAAGGNPSPKIWLQNNDTCLLASTSERALKSVNTPTDMDDLNN